MKGLIIVIRNEKLDAVKNILQNYNSGGMTVSNVVGCGRQKGYADLEGVVFHPDKKVSTYLLSKIQINVIVKDSDVNDLINQICDVAQTGKCGDGKIFVYDVLDAVRIRTNEHGEDAI